ncbi:MAG: SpoIID/LytB domain-containing protein [Candidatus Delongbacteria bacterium]|jgi:stage II sporulation protein D|nr:SpoIID/LytB domain-containing protein [Candidatus Delongbacteria bacterium]
MGLFYRIFLIFIFIFLSCTPITQEKNISIKETIKEKIAIEPKQKKIIVPKKTIVKSSNNVRVGLVENEKKIIFSFKGSYSIYNEQKMIFKKKQSTDTWKAYLTKDKILCVENVNSGEKVAVNNKIIFKPEQIASYIKLGKIKSGKGWHWENTKSRCYKGSIEFIKFKGKITVVNDVGVEQYLYGVVPSEMSALSPFEALKAQAVLARTNVFSDLGKKYKNKPYSLYSDVYSQVYTGISKTHERANKAVDETRGIILRNNGKPVQALFHSVCGGHLESNDVIWSGNKLSYLPSKVDGSSNLGKYNDLSSERLFKKWIDSRPDAYCNMADKKINKALNYAKKYFRWTKKYSRKKLEQIIKKKTGKNFGTLKDIKIVKRGKSGKAISLKVVGTKSTVTINKELNIRKKLSNPPLYSANFYVIKKGGYTPSEFIFKGAGFGHGTGMCQIGACGMASLGKDFREILDFYFPNTKLSSIEMNK